VSGAVSPNSGPIWNTRAVFRFPTRATVQILTTIVVATRPNPDEVASLDFGNRSPGSLNRCRTSNDVLQCRFSLTRDSARLKTRQLNPLSTPCGSTLRRSLYHGLVHAKGRTNTDVFDHAFYYGVLSQRDQACTARCRTGPYVSR
jgi:hypothetical protein